MRFLRSAADRDARSGDADDTSEDDRRGDPFPAHADANKPMAAVMATTTNAIRTRPRRLDADPPGGAGWGSARDWHRADAMTDQAGRPRRSRTLSRMTAWVSAGSNSGMSFTYCTGSGRPSVCGKSEPNRSRSMPMASRRRAMSSS